MSLQKWNLGNKFMVKIVVLGSFNMDLVTYVERIPNIGETVTDGTLHTLHGGKGSNQAVATARLGAEVSFIGCVGDDQFAQEAYDLWAKEGINTQHVRQVANIATGTASILVDAKGENIIAVAPGANREPQTSDILEAEAEIVQADILMAQLEVPLEIVEFAFEIAKKHGTKTLLNPAPVRDGLENLLNSADIITPNEGEAQALGELPEDKIIVTTLGSKGARWQKNNETGVVSAFKVEAIDTVGGGDAFNAGLAVALAEGKSLADAVQFANAVAGLAVIKRGATAGMPQREDVDAFLAKSQ